MEKNQLHLKGQIKGQILCCMIFVNPINITTIE